MVPMERWREEEYFFFIKKKSPAEGQLSYPAPAFSKLLPLLVLKTLPRQGSRTTPRTLCDSQESPLTNLTPPALRL